ncbi:MAG: hypothetical protein NTW46_00990 [Candidatus Nealsonbacteria bacterium]|nr:hypothetical protein [Candidatus Nealsonbacteria bacterium]
MIKKFLYLPIFFISIFFAKSALAVCPVCVVAVSTGVGLCRWLGIDDAISGLWIGGLIVSMIFWTLDWLKKKNINFAYPTIAVSVAYYVLVILPLYFAGIMGHPLNKVLGIDKILFGVICGSIIFLLSVWLHNYLKTKNQGKSYFPYQKVVIPVALLLALSVFFYYYLCKILS